MIAGIGTPRRDQPKTPHPEDVQATGGGDNQGLFEAAGTNLPRSTAKPSALEIIMGDGTLCPSLNIIAAKT